MTAPAEAAALDLVDVGCDEAGAALLGSALFGNADARGAVAGLRGDDLTDTRQRAVLAAVQTLIARDAPIDPVTVVGAMRGGGSTEVRLPAGRDAGVYLADLMERGMTGHARWYLGIILEHGIRRATRAAGTRIAQAAGTMPVDELATFVGEQAKVVLAAVERLEAVR